MRKIIVSEFVSVDGVMEDPGGAEPYRYGGWTHQYFDPGVGRFKGEELAASDGLLLGRLTYQGFAAAWPNITDEYGYADRMNNYPKFVVSTTLDKADWNNSTIIRHNVAEEVARLKEQPGQDLLVFGSALLIDTLRRHNLIDQYNLVVFPVVLGSGKRLFTDVGDKTGLKLVKSQPFDSGVIANTYEVSGATSTTS